MKVNRYKFSLYHDTRISDNLNGDYVTYVDYLKLNNMYQNQHETLSLASEKNREYYNLLVEMLDYYKIGGYSDKSGMLSVSQLGNMIRDSIEIYIDDQLDDIDAPVNNELQAEVEHLRSYTDHLVNFSKLPCLPKDLEILRTANSNLAIENQQLKDKIESLENDTTDNFIRSEFRKHVEAAEIFQCMGKYSNRCGLKIGSSTVIDGIKWADKEIERLDNEIIGLNNKWDAAIQRAAIAENILEAIQSYITMD